MARPDTVLTRCLTVEELTKHLKQFPGDMRVFFAHPAHDYVRTTLASTVDTVDTTVIGWSENHQQYKIPREKNDDDHDPEKSLSAVVLS